MHCAGTPVSTTAAGNTDPPGTTFNVTPPTGFVFTDGGGGVVTTVESGSVLALTTDDQNAQTILSFTVDGSVDFGHVNAGISVDKAWVHFPSDQDKVGIVGDVTLYIPAFADNNAVVICPGATSDADIASDCVDAIVLTAEEPTLGGYTWVNTERAGLEPFEISSAIAHFSTGGMGQTYWRVGGTVSGLIGTVVLSLNSGSSLNVSGNGEFVFPDAILDESTFDVQVQTQPQDPVHQTCVVTSNTGTVHGADVTDISVVCSTTTYSVGGIVLGISSPIVLRNNDGDDLTVDASGLFEFSHPVADGSGYAVTVHVDENSPIPQICNASSHVGTIHGANVNDVLVECTSVSFVVTPRADAHGHITPSVVQTVFPGDSITFVATADAHYHVGQWLLDGVAAQSGGTIFTLTNVQEEHRVSVGFDLNQYIVSASAGVHGSVSPATPQTVYDGSDVVFTATPDAEYHVYQWLVDGTVQQTGGTEFTLTNVDDHHSVTVTFAINQYVVSVGTLSNGSLSPSSPQTVTSGGSVTFTATPGSNFYMINQWLVDGVVMQTGGSSYSLANVTSDHTVTVTFVRVFAYLASNNDQGGGDYTTRMQYCAVNTSTGALSSCSATSGAISNWEPFNVAFATVNDTTYGYVSDNYSRYLARCALNTSSGDLTNCVSASLPNDFSATTGVAIATFASTTYAFVTDHVSHHVYRCAIYATGNPSTNGTINTDSCVNVTPSPVPHSGNDSSDWSPISLTFATAANNSTYLYLVSYIGGYAVHKCTINPSTFVLDSCSKLTPASGSLPATPQGLSFATVNGTQYVYFASTDLTRCTLTNSGDLNVCVGMTGPSKPPTPYGVAVTTLGSNVFGYSTYADSPGHVYLCAMNANDGTFSSCAITPSSSEPAWRPRGVTLLTVP